MRRTHVSGHGLLSEGAPYMIGEDGDWERSGHFHTVSGVGCGICQCGAASPVLTSSTQRRKWHNEHKAKVSQ